MTSITLADITVDEGYTGNGEDGWVSTGWYWNCAKENAGEEGFSTKEAAIEAAKNWFKTR